jgi:hypothetical protein
MRLVASVAPFVRKEVGRFVAGHNAAEDAGSNGSVRRGCAIPARWRALAPSPPRKTLELWSWRCTNAWP